MAGPMPPGAGGGMPPAGAGGPPGAAAPDQSDEGGGGVGAIIVETDKNLAQLAKAAPPEYGKRLQEISTAFRGLIDEMMQSVQGGDGAPPGAAPGPSKAPPRAPASQMSSPMAGGNPNARPAGY